MLSARSARLTQRTPKPEGAFSYKNIASPRSDGPAKKNKSDSGKWDTEDWILVIIIILVVILVVAAISLVIWSASSGRSSRAERRANRLRKKGTQNSVDEVVGFDMEEPSLEEIEVEMEMERKGRKIRKVHEYSPEERNLMDRERRRKKRLAETQNQENDNGNEEIPKPSESRPVKVPPSVDENIQRDSELIREEKLRARREELELVERLVNAEIRPQGPAEVHKEEPAAKPEKTDRVAELQKMVESLQSELSSIVKEEVVEENNDENDSEDEVVDEQALKEEMAKLRQQMDALQTKLRNK